VPCNVVAKFVVVVGSVGTGVTGLGGLGATLGERLGGGNGAGVGATVPR